MARLNHPMIDYPPLTAPLALELLGEPEHRSGANWRYDKDQKISIDVQNGIWINHAIYDRRRTCDRGGGGVLDLIIYKVAGIHTHADAKRWLINNGWIDGRAIISDVELRKRRAADAKKEARQVKSNRRRAREIWQEAVALPGTPAERYLAARAIEQIADSHELRFHRGLWHPHAPADTRIPAIISRVSDVEGKGVAIYRTFLRLDGADKFEFEPVRKALGSTKSHAIRLYAPVDDEILLGTGLETTASAAEILSVAGAWAATCDGGLRAIQLPPEIRRILIAADMDASGLDAAADAAERFRAEGRNAEIYTPAEGFDDFNDEAMHTR